MAPGAGLEPARLLDGRLTVSYGYQFRHPGIEGGIGGIRTPVDLSAKPVFKTGAINHSATPPW